MLERNLSAATIGLAAVLAIAIGVGANALPNRGGHTFTGEARAEGAQPSPTWAASATGRVEPKTGEVRIASQVPGKIADVVAETNDAVKDNDLLLRLDDQEIYVRIAAAEAEAGVRVRERDEENVTGLALERRNGVDNVSKAERQLFAAREALDAAWLKPKGERSGDNIEKARVSLRQAEKKLADARAEVSAIKNKPGMPLETRLEASLANARADLSAAEIALEKTRVRAPADGTVLNMIAKAGETAVPSPDSALVVFGDLTGLRVRAEVEERDAGKIFVGQKVVIKADAFPDRQFEGRVTSISQSLGAPRIASRGPRRPNDVEVIEAMVALDGNPPLFTGMRVDVFFKPESSASNTTGAKSN